MFQATKFRVEQDVLEPENAPDAVILTFVNGNGEEIQVRMSGYTTYPSEHGPPFDETISVAEDFLAELASMLGYDVSE